MKIYSNNSKYSLPMLVGSALVLTMSALPAAAGQWVLDHYESNGQSIGKAISLEYGYFEASSPQRWRSVIQTKKTVESWSDQGQKYKNYLNGQYQPGDNSNVASATITWGNGRSYPLHLNSAIVNGATPQTATVNRSVRAVFRWVREPVFHYPPGSEEPEWEPDPNDKPPEYCWMIEGATISGSQFTGQWDHNPLSYFQTHYYQDSEFTFSNIKHPFGLTYNGMPKDSYGYSSTYGGSFSMDDLQVTGFKTLPGKDIAIGPERSLSAQVDLNTYILGVLDRQATASVSCGYSAVPALLRVYSRRKSDHDPNDLRTDFDSQSSVLAGGNVTDYHDHEADVVLEVCRQEWGSWIPVGNVKMKHVPAMQKVNPEGVSVSLKLLGPDGTYSGILDRGRAPIGKVLSRDKIDDSLAAWIGPNKSGGEPTLITHGWGNVEWKMGVNGDKPWSISFPSVTGEQTDTEYKEWIWARIKDGVKPLKNHTMKFVAERLVVRVESDDPEDLYSQYPGTTTQIFTTNKNETGTNVTRADDIDSLVAPYITLPPAQEAGEGTYKGQLLVKKNPDFVVESFRLALEDQGVYKRKN